MLCYPVEVPRPRTLDFDHLLDVAEQLAAESGPPAVTIRALSEATAISNGAIYHAFGSRGGLLGHVWLRAGKRYLSFQRAAVAKALSRGVSGEAAVDAVVAAAECPATFSHEHPASARFLLRVRRDELLGAADVPAELADELRRLDDDLAHLFIELAEKVWGRRDRQAVGAIRTCVVELPTALLIDAHALRDAAALQRLAAAVRAVLALTPPTTSTKPKPRPTLTKGAHP